MEEKEPSLSVYKIRIRIMNPPLLSHILLGKTLADSVYHL